MRKIAESREKVSAQKRSSGRVSSTAFFQFRPQAAAVFCSFATSSDAAVQQSACRRIAISSAVMATRDLLRRDRADVESDGGVHALKKMRGKPSFCSVLKISITLRFEPIMPT